MSNSLSSTSHKWFDPLELPDTLPIFPLSGVILLPHARLPLNVFEPRYLSMVQDVLGMTGRMMGIIQPNEAIAIEGVAPKLYNIGCAGRITSFNETEDGRFLISLTGLCRFTVKEEIATGQPYRLIQPDWSNYAADFEEANDDDVDRPRLLNALQRYFKAHDIAADWNAVQSTPSDALIASLVMIAPLTPSEKQGLLECADLNARANMLIALMEMSIFPRSDNEGGGVRH